MRRADAGALPFYTVRLVSRLLQKLWLLAAVAVGAVAFTAPPANAACTPSAHCYGAASWDVSGSSGSGFLGAHAMVRTNCMTVGNPNGDIVTNEVWVVRKANYIYFEAAGITVGSPFGSSPVLFREVQGSSHQLHMYSGGSASMNSYTPVDIRYASGTSWTVWVGNFGTTSDMGVAYANWLEAGMEVGASSAHTFGSVSSLQWYSLGNNLYTNWTSGGAAGNAALLSPPSPAYSSWVTPYSHVQAGIGSSC